MAQFTALTHRERDEAYKYLVDGQRPVQIQIPGEKLRQGKVEERREQRIYFQLPFTQRFETYSQAVVTFSLPPEVYFLKTQVGHHNGKFYFEEVEEVFRLQRRDSFRLTIPESIPTKVVFENGKSFRIYDISQGGFSIELPAVETDMFVTGTKVQADIEIRGESFSAVNCESKHARVQPLVRTKVLVGFQFHKLGPKMEQALFRIITDIARTHFR